MGDTHLESSKSNNTNDNEVVSTIELVNHLPNQVSTERENEANEITVSVELHPIKDAMNVLPTLISENSSTDERSITSTNRDTVRSCIIKTNKGLKLVRDDSISAISPMDQVFPLDLERGKVETSEAYKDSREYKSIMKSVTLSSLLLFLIPILFIFFHTAIMNEMVGTIFFVLFMILCKVFRSFVVMFGSIYCFELVRLLFSTMITNTVESFQETCTRFRNYF